MVGQAKFEVVQRVERTERTEEKFRLREYGAVA